MASSRVRYGGYADKSRNLRYTKSVLALWTKRAFQVRKQAQNPPRLRSWLCIHRYEGSWADPNGPYYGGLQMDMSFMQEYGGWLLRHKGTADHWTPLEQIWVAERALRSWVLPMAEHGQVVRPDLSSCGTRASPFPELDELVADDLDDPASVALAVELDEEHALPLPELELAVAQRHRLAGAAEEHRHAMRVPVALVHVLGADVLGAAVPVVVCVVVVGRAEPAEQLAEVLEEPLLELVHAHAAGRVRGVDAGDAVLDAALLDCFRDLVGDIAHGADQPTVRRWVSR